MVKSCMLITCMRDLNCKKDLQTNVLEVLSVPEILRRSDTWKT